MSLRRVREPRAPLVPMLVGAVAIVTLAGSFAQTPALTPPIGSAIVLDGTIDDDEWRPSLVQPMEGGGTVYLMRHGESLFVGIRGPAEGTAHVCVATGDQVHVLHASAAVGSGTYKRAGDRWTRTKDFTWSLRDPATDDSSAAARQTYLQSEGWVGTVTAMGRAADREIALDRRRFRDSPLRIAVAYVTLTADKPGAVAHWPLVSDTCTDQKTVSGLLPETARFAVREWAGVQ